MSYIKILTLKGLQYNTSIICLKSLIILTQVHNFELFSAFFSADEGQKIGEPITLKEIEGVLKTFAHEKSLGPNGWRVEIFLAFFDIMGEDLLQMVAQSRSEGFVFRALNQTYIALIPKKNKPESFNDYRPIALCSLVYKIITKIIANRIKPILPAMMTWEQFASCKQTNIGCNGGYTRMHYIP